MGTSLVPHQLSPSYPLSSFFLDLHSGRSKTAKDSRSSIGYPVCMAIQRPHWPELGTRVEKNPSLALHSPWKSHRRNDFFGLVGSIHPVRGGRHTLVIRRNTMRCIAGPTVTWGFPSGGSRHRVTLHCHHTFFFFLFFQLELVMEWAASSVVSVCVARIIYF